MANAQAVTLNSGSFPGEVVEGESKEEDGLPGELSRRWDVGRMTVSTEGLA